jgi:hypothetical protein
MDFKGLAADTRNLGSLQVFDSAQGGKPGLDVLAAKVLPSSPLRPVFACARDEDRRPRSRPGNLISKPSDGVAQEAPISNRRTAGKLRTAPT